MRRTEIFNALVTSKLLYGLSTIVLTTADRRRLDGFQNQCLRKIWNILLLYLSRITNARVLEVSSQIASSERVLGTQLVLYGKAARAPVGILLRDCVFCPGSLRPASDRYVRRIGRPRLEWATNVQNAAMRSAGSWATLETAVMEAETWKKMLAL